MSPLAAAAVTAPLKFLTVPAASKHTATVIFIHGLGDTGHGWKPVADMFKVDPLLSHIKWVLPHSPVRSVTANLGLEMPSWFDIYSFGFSGEEDEAGMLQSSRQINELITAEVNAGVDPGRIVLGGFSQGGAMSLLTGLTSERKLAGLAVLSGWLPLHKKIQAMVSQHALSTPIFWGHGTADPLVKYQMCKDSVDYLTTVIGIPKATQGDNKGLKCIPYEGMAHVAFPEELDDLKSWLKNVIPKEGGRL
ncbi:hypothetical protein AMATHDRAFT_148040 [Amanita thiersii Skay4041]|uniref:Acyl-protein thioesterase 1 n=1 Tax=Amanita thiersii Skay4041 TaxID=703135 RepID=A0A2A9NIW6_9AGAR|nr:hypothetical protein AMATHDRAFT_148040 [Amanita thiersii Skay4041]